MDAEGLSCARTTLRALCAFAARSAEKAGAGLSEEDFARRLCLVHSGYGSIWTIGFAPSFAPSSAPASAVDIYGSLQRLDGTASVHFGAAFMRKFPPMKSDTGLDGNVRVPLSDARLDGLLGEILLKIAENGSMLRVSVPNKNVIPEGEAKAARELIMAKARSVHSKIAAAAQKYGLYSAEVEDARTESLTILAEMASLCRAERPNKVVEVLVAPKAGSLEELSIKLAVS